MARKRERRAAFMLNRGSSSFGRSNVVSLNREGGTFGSGHPAGGGAGAGQTLAESLLSPAASVLGAVGPQGSPTQQSSQDVPAVTTQAPVPVSIHEALGAYPTFNPQPIPRSILSGSTAPRTSYPIYPTYRRFE